MRILLTGGNGMVGRNVLEHPDAKLYSILAPSSSELNLLNYQVVEKCLIENKPDIIIHTAGRVGGIQANIREPVRYLLENLDMGRNIVWAARQTGIKRLINLGSSCMYPRNAENPLIEEDLLTGELEPTNEGYALAKNTIARLCSYISQEDHSYKFKTLIPCNLYGRWDKFGPENSHMLPGVIQKITDAKIKGQNEVEIWGDGFASREYLYAGDLADCLMHAVKNFNELPSLMNVGTGYACTINAYYQAVAEVIGYNGVFNHNLSKPVGMKKKLVSIEKQEQWGWRPKTSLKEGILKTYLFYLNENKNK
ncbi:NAD-dependent epimerase/dehydratase family protein [Alkalihalobacillus sp. BA299]|uniref:NAD-dependent epimerase/dehydratase family protein n=1 Tax=Alkalihalobacillus sp. BA299 TaxID=2815938 RepID=UPI001ADBF995|nr:NAD-dependent epimerase/dehydratase family protein [Alkalihalobacillus sp. BA299]